MSLISDKLTATAAEYVKYASNNAHERQVIECEIVKWINDLTAMGSIRVGGQVYGWTGIDQYQIEVRPHDDPYFLCQITMVFPHLTVSTRSSTPSPDDAYDRAMRGI